MSPMLSPVHALMQVTSEDCRLCIVAALQEKKVWVDMGRDVPA